MFNRENKIEKFKDAETIIGASIKVKGNFHGQGNIVIEGSLEGSLKTDANIFIGEKAKVVANVEAQDLMVNGEIKGNVKVKNYLSLGSTAKISGDIAYSEMSMEKGATINGQLFAISETEKKSIKNSVKEDLEK
ncbi:MAG: polymer-forming cytoskeletal protein [Patescibacteria group bacterium]|jgi:cytoskeletal protein CcmA (bactofilin family)|nr:polymer-forming cytoskeletal protein [Patescibacteria group bacterium]MDD3777792.1 polymer-forming cytoskeletal protein [Patescibacteria group bacterium]MDD3939598.1 polymer-forming cytoskeletal protein [Patescibacteria group bacterium]MDD4443539.1 polymer-forming cytoskeletal protein [Patescibacteria group bacterium]NCU39475.1 polymer-forming cytoskeletal protein [Candidatus Falkowbacteria bacterium]